MSALEHGQILLSALFFVQFVAVLVGLVISDQRPLTETRTGLTFWVVFAAAVVLSYVALRALLGLLPADNNGVGIVFLVGVLLQLLSLGLMRLK